MKMKSSIIKAKVLLDTEPVDIPINTDDVCVIHVKRDNSIEIKYLDESTSEFTFKTREDLFNFCNTIEKLDNFVNLSGNRFFVYAFHLINSKNINKILLDQTSYGMDILFCNKLE